MSAFSGSEKVTQALEAIAKKMADGHVEVGFMEGATYPDGESVPGVAYKNEFGDPANHQPPRPFFRRMIAKEASSWPGKVAKLAKATDYDGPRVMAIMGEDIGAALVQSIRDLTDPPLAKKTIELKGFDKPLIDTGVMMRAVTYRVDDGEKKPIQGGS